MLGLREMATMLMGCTLAACTGPAPQGAGTTGGAASSGGAESSTGAPSGETGGGTTDAATSAGTTGDGSWDTDYPVEPGCDEGDEGWQEYAESSEGDGGTSGGAEASGIGMGGDFPLSATVYEIRTGMIPGGELVQLTDVVVTAPPVVAPDGVSTLLFVQEEKGGPNSGINIRIGVSTPEVDALVPGDRITLRGDFIERYVFATIEVTYATEAFDIGSAGPAPEPYLVEPAMVTAGSELATSLESVLVQVQQAQVIDPQACVGEVLVQARLKIDDRYLAADGQSLPAPTSGVYSSVTGPLIYTYNGFEIAPRTLADLGL